jgi:hypothetical protein
MGPCEVPESEGDRVGRRFAALPAAERARRYRELATAAFTRAAAARDESMRKEYLSLASAWQVLAIEIEHMFGLVPPPVAHPNDPRDVPKPPNSK